MEGYRGRGFPSQHWPPSGEAARDPSTVRETLPEFLVGGLGRESPWFLVEIVRAWGSWFYSLVLIGRSFKCNCRSALCVIFGTYTLVGNLSCKKQIPCFELAYSWRGFIGSSNRRYRYKVGFKIGLIWWLNGVIKHSVHLCLFPPPFCGVCLIWSLAFPGGRIAAVVPRFISKHHTF